MAKQTKVKAANSAKYEYAYLLYMQGLAQNDICEKVSISAPTIQKWKESGGWEQKRAVRTISIDDLMQKTLRKINDLLDIEGNAFSADAFAKAVAQLKALKESHTIDDEISTFLAFQDYLIIERIRCKDITDEFIKKVVRFQDDFILSHKNSEKR